MAKVDITIGRVEEADRPRYVAALAWKFGYRETDIGTGEPNTMTRGEYVKGKMRRFVIGATRDYEEWLAKQLINVTDIEITD